MSKDTYKYGYRWIKTEEVVSIKMAGISQIGETGKEIIEYMTKTRSTRSKKYGAMGHIIIDEAIAFEPVSLELAAPGFYLTLLLLMKVSNV